MLQDSTVLAKIKKVVTARIVRFFGDEAKARPEQYLKFYNEYANFLKEGIVTDAESKVCLCVCVCVCMVILSLPPSLSLSLPLSLSASVTMPSFKKFAYSL